MTKLFMPYQAAWINDKSRIKIVEKSRRVGLTFCQAYEDVKDCVEKNVPAVWFSSADISAAKEYIEYCIKWAAVYKIAASQVEEQVIEKETVLTLHFVNGTKIVALSSSPNAFRSKGGKVVLDEFAFHENADALWKAARPSITWGFPLRILSTHNGKSCLYYKFLEEVKTGKLGWSLHTIDIHRAVAEGLVDKIMGRATTEEEKIEWLESERKSCGDPSVWMQEYCCIPVDETTAFLTFDLIKSCESDHKFEIDPAANNFIGIDVGRKKDLTVMWVLTKDGSTKKTSYIEILGKTAYSEQLRVASDLITKTKAKRVCIDSTGIGDMLAETLQEKFGSYRVEKVHFTNEVKSDLAFSLRNQFEDKTVAIPSDEEIRNDLHSIKKLTTSAGNIRFDANRSESDGHGDRFWALALALHAMDNEKQPLKNCIGSSKKRFSEDLLKGY